MKYCAYAATTGSLEFRTTTMSNGSHLAVLLGESYGDIGILERDSFMKSSSSEFRAD